MRVRAIDVGEYGSARRRPGFPNAEFDLKRIRHFSDTWMEWVIPPTPAEIEFEKQNFAEDERLRKWRMNRKAGMKAPPTIQGPAKDPKTALSQIAGVPVTSGIENLTGAAVPAPVATPVAPVSPVVPVDPVAPVAPAPVAPVVPQAPAPGAANPPGGVDDSANVL